VFTRRTEVLARTGRRPTDGGRREGDRGNLLKLRGYFSTDIA
jgi:hypothetical protein